MPSVRSSPGRRLVILGALACCLASIAAFGQEPTNRFCPVQKDQLAKREYSTVYQGRRVYFCCEDCVVAFELDPQAYRASLEPAPTPPTRKSSLGHDHPPHWQPPGLDGGATVDGGATEPGWRRWGRYLVHQFAGWFAGLVLVAAFLLAVFRSRGSDGQASSRPGALVLVLPVRSALLLTLLAGLMITLELLERTAERDGRLAAESQIDQAQLRDKIHFATFSDFGDPPRPVRAPGPPRLSATFYRGNDERSPGLFNGGHYRTATFHVSLRDASGGELVHGQSVAGLSVVLRLDIERGPNTPDFFWLPARMQTMYLTQDKDPFAGGRGPVADRVDLTEVDKLQLWRANYPLGPLAGGAETRTGIVYLREQMKGGARFHYGLAYALRSEAGRLAADTDLSMGALYRTRNVLPHRLPLSEWFSHLPIPTLPAPRVARPEDLKRDLDSGTN